MDFGAGSSDGKRWDAEEMVFVFLAGLGPISSE